MFASAFAEKLKEALGKFWSKSSFPKEETKTQKVPQNRENKEIPNHNSGCQEPLTIQRSVKTTPSESGRKKQEKVVRGMIKTWITDQQPRPSKPLNKNPSQKRHPPQKRENSLGKTEQILIEPERLQFTFTQNQTLGTPLTYKDSGLEFQKVKDTGDEAEIYLGLDFGTSSLKCVCADNDFDKAYPVVFRKDKGINAFILPTNLYEDENGSFSIEREFGRIHNELKRNLIENHSALKNKVLASIYLSLAFKKIKAWFFDNLYDELYKGFSLIWSINIGVPSCNAEDTIMGIWEEVALVGWILSGHEKPTKEMAKQLILSHEAGKLISPENFQIKAHPELSANVYSIVEASVDHENGQLYAMLDVGASTVDISAFYFHKAKDEISYTTTLSNPSVIMKGTAHCHRERIDSLIKCLKRINMDVKLKGEIINSLELERVLRPLSLLPKKIDDYFIGLKSTEKYFPDNPFISDIAKCLRGKINPVNKTNDLKTKIIISGGGANHPVYLEAMNRVIGKGRLAEKMELNEKPKHLTFHNSYPSSLTKEDIWQRLSVAYGLSRNRLATVKVEWPEQQPEVSKEMGIYIGKDYV